MYVPLFYVHHVEIIKTCIYTPFSLFDLFCWTCRGCCFYTGANSKLIGIAFCFNVYMVPKVLQ